VRPLAWQLNGLCEAVINVTIISVLVSLISVRYAPVKNGVYKCPIRIATGISHNKK